MTEESHSFHRNALVNLINLLKLIGQKEIKSLNRSIKLNKSLQIAPELRLSWFKSQLELITIIVFRDIIGKLT